MKVEYLQAKSFLIEGIHPDLLLKGVGLKVQDVDWVRILGFG